MGPWNSLLTWGFSEIWKLTLYYRKGAGIFLLSQMLHKLVTSNNVPPFRWSGRKGNKNVQSCKKEEKRRIAEGREEDYVLTNNHVQRWCWKWSLDTICPYGSSYNIYFPPRRALSLCVCACVCALLLQFLSHSISLVGRVLVCVTKHTAASPLRNFSSTKTLGTTGHSSASISSLPSLFLYLSVHRKRQSLIRSVLSFVFLFAISIFSLFLPYIPSLYSAFCLIDDTALSSPFFPVVYAFLTVSWRAPRLSMPFITLLLRIRTK